MNIWLEGLYLEKIREIQNKQEDVSLSKKGEELQDTSANGRRSKGTKVKSTGNQTSNLA